MIFLKTIVKNFLNFIQNATNDELCLHFDESLSSLAFPKEICQQRVAMGDDKLSVLHLAAKRCNLKACTILIKQHKMGIFMTYNFVFRFELIKKFASIV